MDNIKLPKAFLNRMQKILEADFDPFVNSFNAKVPVSIRLNPLKPNHSFDNNTPIPWCEHGRYLDERPDFVFDPGLHSGTYYVQEASSMMFQHAIDFSKDLKVLDLCAAPGGKSTLLLSKLSPNSILFSNELVRKRSAILYENLVKWGNHNGVITTNSVEDFTDFTAYFDVVVVDAPCSGEGMFRKDHELIKEWKENKPFVCSVAQKNILDQAIKLVKNEGILIYMTCTFSLEENEQMVEWFCKKYYNNLELQQINVNPEWGIKKLHVNVKGKNHEVYRCYPHKLEGEGMFIASFSVRNIERGSFTKKYISELHPLTKHEKEKVGQFVKPDYLLENTFKVNDKIYVLPLQYFKEIIFALKKLNTLKAGVFAGSFNTKNKEFIPSHELAMSNLINKKELPVISLDLKQSIYYLKKMEINNQLKLPVGWILAEYKGVVLGWLKNTGSRLNNFYPKEWVIRKNYTN